MTLHLRRHTAMRPPSFQSPPPVFVELASGVDALYMSGRASLPGDLIGRLEVAREEATRSNVGIPFHLGGVEFTMAPYNFGMYRFCLDHPHGRIGLTTSSHLPAIRVQPRTEYLQGSGPPAAVEWFRGVLERACDAVLLSVIRLDLFADFQGWELIGDSRHEFVCRAKFRHTYEDNEVFNGLILGKRKTGTILARLYDKTIESAISGSGYWKMIWGDRFDPSRSVLRVEFEIGRDGLRDFGLSSPEEVLDAVGSVWVYLTREWLTHRVAGSDQTKSRWAVSPEWEQVRRAEVGINSYGINRMYLGKRRGGVENIMPRLVGYLGSFGAYAEAMDLDQMLPQLRDALLQYERDKGILLSERIAVKRRKFGLL